MDVYICYYDDVSRPGGATVPPRAQTTVRAQPRERTKRGGTPYEPPRACVTSVRQGR